MKNLKKDKRIALDQPKFIEQSFSQVSQSEYSFKDVLDINQFVKLSQQIKIDTNRANNLAQSFYHSKLLSKSKQTPFQRQITAHPSQYKASYQQWKEESSNKTQVDYQSAINLMKNKLSRQQRQKSIIKCKNTNPIYKFSQQNTGLQKIKKDYTKKLSEMTKQSQMYTTFKQKYEQNRENKQMSRYGSSIVKQPLSCRDDIDQSHLINNQKERIIELQVQKQLLNRIKNINYKQKQMQDLKKSEVIFRKTCFVDMISKPPLYQIKSMSNSLNSTKNLHKDHHEMNYCNVDHIQKQKYKHNNEVIPLRSINISPRRQKQTKQPKLRYKLNIKQILKLPHRLFLIFYSQNYHQIIRLTTPQQLKRLNDYRGQALSKHEAVQSLKKKINAQGASLINKLTNQQRQKLFKVLYSDDVEEQKYYQGKLNKQI